MSSETPEREVDAPQFADPHPPFFSFHNLSHLPSRHRDPDPAFHVSHCAFAYSIRSSTIRHCHCGISATCSSLILMKIRSAGEHEVSDNRKEMYEVYQDSSVYSIGLLEVLSLGYLEKLLTLSVVRQIVPLREIEAPEIW